jgi:hypothetical protein
MPPDVRESLPEDHPACFVIEAVSAMDLDAFYAAYRDDGRSRPAYDRDDGGAVALHLRAGHGRRGGSNAAHGSRLGAVVDRREPPHAASFDLRMRRATVSAKEARPTCSIPAPCRPSKTASRSTAGDDGTLARANHRPIGASYREVMHAACER